MRCEYPGCRGSGMVADVGPENAHGWFLVRGLVPCPRCQGSGIQHCCEGDQRQPGEPAEKGD